MQAGFFGASATQRYRVYHPPEVAGGRPRAVLLCHVGPEEYRHTHFAFRQLATRLADAGVHAMRFDWRGTGDSAGDLRDCTLDTWVEDVHEAAEELRALSGVSRLSVVGMRLGAAVATRAVASGLRVQDLVLWDPVVNGAAYAEELAALHERVRLDYAYPVSDASAPDECLGYQIPPALARSVAAIDLLSEPRGEAAQAWIVTAACDQRASTLAEAWRADGCEALHTIIADVSPATRSWDEDTLLPRAIPAAIVERLTGASGGARRGAAA